MQCKYIHFFPSSNTIQPVDMHTRMVLMTDPGSGPRPCLMYVCTHPSTRSPCLCKRGWWMVSRELVWKRASFCATAGAVPTVRRLQPSWMVASLDRPKRCIWLADARRARQIAPAPCSSPIARSPGSSWLLQRRIATDGSAAARRRAAGLRAGVAAGGTRRACSRSATAPGVQHDVDAAELQGRGAVWRCVLGIF